MKNLIIGLIILLAATPSYAVDFFYNKAAPPWNVIGKLEKDKNDTCYISRSWHDGSFYLYKDLKDDEIYFVLTNTKWNIQDKIGLAKENINIIFVSSRGVLDSGTVNYELLSNNTIRVREIEGSKFYKGFTNNSRMRFVMPGNITDVEFDLSGSRQAASNQYQCYTIYQNKFK